MLQIARREDELPSKAVTGFTRPIVHMLVLCCTVFFSIRFLSTKESNLEDGCAEFRSYTHSISIYVWSFDSVEILLRKVTSMCIGFAVCATNNTMKNECSVWSIVFVATRLFSSQYLHQCWRFIVFEAVAGRYLSTVQSAGVIYSGLVTGAIIVQSRTDLSCRVRRSRAGGGGATLRSREWKPAERSVPLL